MAGVNQSFLESPQVKKLSQITYDMWQLGWAERHSGNISCLLTEEEVSPYLDTDSALRRISLDFPVNELANRYLLITGSGKYFKNIKDDLEGSLGLLRIHEDGKGADLLCGLADGGRPTSELPTHLMSHIVRSRRDPSHRVIMHTHPTHLVAMSFNHDLDEQRFTRTLWKMCTECIVVFPEGIGILPWMVPGTDSIGRATARKMEQCRLVLWPHHGIFGAGTSLDDAFGLIETAEKAAQVYMLANGQRGGMKQAITDRELLELAHTFGVTPASWFQPAKE